jgi:hypothetical protein
MNERYKSGEKKVQKMAKPDVIFALAYGYGWHC